MEKDRSYKVVAVSLPKELYAAAEDARWKLKQTRSEFYRDALTKVIEKMKKKGEIR